MNDSEVTDIDKSILTMLNSSIQALGSDYLVAFRDIILDELYKREKSAKETIKKIVAEKEENKEKRENLAENDFNLQFN